MKKVLVLTVLSVVTTTGLCEDTMDVRAEQLSDTLCIPTNSVSQIWSNPLFPSNGIISTNSFVIKSKESILDNVVEFEVLQTNTMVATGILFECDSFNSTRAALLRQMVMNSLPMEMITMCSIVQTNTIGDFCITEKVMGTTSQAATNPSSIDFIRGAKAIRLNRHDNVDIQPIAQMLDDLLKR